MARPIDGELLKNAIQSWIDTQSELVDVETCAMVLAAIAVMPTLTPPNEPERAGLYGKYTVHRNKDGSLVTDCFVLRPAKDPAAVIALRAYAAATDNAELSADIINWVGAEPNEPLTLEMVAEILAEQFGDECACNFNGNDEWLPEVCQYENTCPNPPERLGCWMELLRHKYRRPPEGEEDNQ